MLILLVFLFCLWSIYILISQVQILWASDNLQLHAITYSLEVRNSPMAYSLEEEEILWIIITIIPNSPQPSHYTY
jgi:hypothetical protein